jgi:hypothetical protein
MGVSLGRASIVLAGAALAGALLPAAAQAKTLTIAVTSVSTSLVTHETGANGAVKGDTITYRDKLLNAKAQFGKKKGALVGADSGVTTFTSPQAATFNGKATLPGGTVILRGRLRALGNGGLTIPIAGGTGNFAGASGTLTVGPGDDHVLNTYRLVLPSTGVA